MSASPADDQRRARLRDMQRFLDLIRPYLAGPGINALDRMPPAEAAEARELLARIGPIGEPPEKAAARQAILTDCALADVALHDMLTRHRDDAMTQQIRDEIRRFRQLGAGSPACLPVRRTRAAHHRDHGHRRHA